MQYSKPAEAKKLFRRALQSSKEKNYVDGISSALFALAFTEAGEGNLEGGLTLCMEALPHCKMSPGAMMAHWYVNTGILNVYQENYKSAASYFHQGLDEAKRLKLPPENPVLLSVYNNLSGVYIRMDQPLTALKYLLISEELSRNKNFARELAFTLCNKGDALYALNRFDEATSAYQEGLEITLTHGFEEIGHAIYGGLGKLLIAQDRPLEAIRNLQKIEALADKHNPLYSSIWPGYSMGQAYYMLKDYQRAERYLIETLEKARSTGHTDGRIDAHKILSSIYEAQMRYPEALEQERIYSTLKEELLNAEKLRDINELEIMYNSAQKDQDIMRNQLEISQQRVSIEKQNTWLWISILAIIVVLAVTFFIVWHNYHKQVNLIGKIQILEAESEIALLRATISGEEQERLRIGRELHDGIGGLLSAVKLQFGSLRLKHESITDDPDFSKAISLVDDVTGEVRKTAHNLMPEILVKSGLVESINSYCERLRSDHSPDIQLQVYGEVPRLKPAIELSIYRIVQELINNILKHAEASEIIVQLNWQDTVFHVSVEDDGIGFDPERDKGAGLNNIHSRVESMAATLEIESRPGVGSGFYLEFFTTKSETVENRTVW